MAPFLVFYCLFCLCFIFPPSAFISAGLTVPSLFSHWLGSEDFLFIQHHIKRTCAAIIVHSLLPLGFFLGVIATEGTGTFTKIVTSPIGFTVFQVAILLPLAAASLVFYWYVNGWKNHPIVKELKLHCGNHSWRAAASEINTEFRGIDKVCVSTNPVTKTVVTSTWIVKVLPYHLRIAKQNHASLILEEQEEHSLSLQNPGGTQYLSVRVQFNQRINGILPKSFVIRLNATDYNTIQDRLQRPIQNIRGLVVHSSVETRFVQVFIEEIQRNPVISSSEDLEPCIGCMSTPANVRLVRRCELTNNEASCSPCFCRPMWCVNCLAKWFAARQDPDHPEQWLSSRSPCPTCRSLFCLLDVSIVEPQSL